MDDVDQLTAREETFAVYQRRQQEINAAKREIQPTGDCHYCCDTINDPEHPQRLFCSIGCRDDWEMSNNHKRAGAWR